MFYSEIHTKNRDILIKRNKNSLHINKKKIIEINESTRVTVCMYRGGTSIKHAHITSRNANMNGSRATKVICYFNASDVITIYLTQYINTRNIRVTCVHNFSHNYKFKIYMIVPELINIIKLTIVIKIKDYY